MRYSIIKEWEALLTKQSHILNYKFKCRAVGTDRRVGIIYFTFFSPTVGKSCTTRDGKLGECIPRESCSYLFEKSLKNRTDEQESDFIRESKCSFSYQSSSPYVCCAIDEECGKRMNSGNKIYGANNSTLGAYRILLI